MNSRTHNPRPVRYKSIVCPYNFVCFNYFTKVGTTIVFTSFIISVGEVDLGLGSFPIRDDPWKTVSPWMMWSPPGTLPYWRESPSVDLLLVY